jgi:hypothetical protein
MDLHIHHHALALRFGLVLEPHRKLVLGDRVDFEPIQRKRQTGNVHSISRAPFPYDKAELRLTRLRVFKRPRRRAFQAIAAPSQLALVFFPKRAQLRKNRKVSAVSVR